VNHKDTVRSTLKITYGTIISKILGFLREVIIAAKFGATSVSDAFFLALQIPVLFRRVLGEEMFEKTVMPVFKNKLFRDKKDAWRFLSAFFWYSVLISLLAVIFLYALKKPLISLIAPGITDPETIGLINKMTTILIPYLILTTIYSFMGTVFNFTRRQFIFAVGPAVSNIAIILAIILLYPYIKEISLPAGFLLGGAFYIVFLVPFFLSKNFRRDYAPRLSISLRHDTNIMKKTFSESAWVFLQALLNKSVELVDRIIASFLIPGSISGLWYAKRLEQLPSSIISMSIARAVLSRLSDCYSEEKIREFGDTVTYGIKLCCSVILPITVLLCILGKPLSIFIYKRGEFSSEAAGLTSSAFMAYSAGLLSVALYNIFSRAYSVLSKNRFTTITMFCASLLNIALSILLATTKLKLAGIALASSISFYFASAVLFAGLKKELKSLDYSFDYKGLYIFFLKLFSASVLMGIPVYYGYKMLYKAFYKGFILFYFDMGLLLIIALASLSGVISYLALCWIFNIRTVKNLFKT